jgi:hypothetical protein
MQRHWNEQELETYWSFSSDEFELIPNGDDSSRLGVGASLKFFLTRRLLSFIRQRHSRCRH